LQNNQQHQFRNSLSCPAVCGSTGVLMPFATA